MSEAEGSRAMRLGNYSYLPALSKEQVAKQVRYLLTKQLIPIIEHTRRPNPNDHYWNMWQLPLFDARGAEDVLAELAACQAANPSSYIKLSGYDRNRQRQPVSFIVHRP